MYKLPYNLILVLFASFSLTNCNKPPVIPKNTTVYITGNSGTYDYTISDLKDYTVTNWKNGVPADLIINSGSLSFSTSIFVTDKGDVYTSGYTYVNSKEVPVLWKNGIPTILSHNDSYNVRAVSVAVSGTDVYVAGFDDENTLLWKNGVLTKIGVYRGWVSSMYVVGKDVYILANGLNNKDEGFVVIYKNGVPTYLNSLGAKGVTGNSIFVFNKTVYVAGSIFTTNGVKFAALWKNGVLTNLSNNDQYEEATSVFVVNNDVYVSGNSESAIGTISAKYWKNGVSISLPGNSAKYQYANAIWVDNKDVYVAGTEVPSDSADAKWKAKYWKNGTPVYLNINKTMSFVSGMYVK